MSKGSTLGKCMSALALEAQTREKLEVIVKSLARVLRAVVGQDRSLCCSPPPVRFLELACQVLVRSASPASCQALREGRLQGLGAVERGGVAWVSGRVRGEDLVQLLGVKDLPILLPEARLSRLILDKSHRQDHRRSPQDIVARSRRAAWILGAARCGKSVAASCHTCRLRDRRTSWTTHGSTTDREGGEPGTL